MGSVAKILRRTPPIDIKCKMIPQNETVLIMTMKVHLPPTRSPYPNNLEMSLKLNHSSSVELKNGKKVKYDESSVGIVGDGSNKIVRSLIRRSEIKQEGGLGRPVKDGGHIQQLLHEHREKTNS